MSEIIASLEIQDCVALAAIAVASVSAALYMKKRRKNGCGGCSGCSGCTYEDKCRNKKESDNNGAEDKLHDKTGENIKKS